MQRGSLVALRPRLSPGVPLSQLRKESDHAIRVRRLTGVGPRRGHHVTQQLRYLVARPTAGVVTLQNAHVPYALRRAELVCDLCNFPAAASGMTLSGLRSRRPPGWARAYECAAGVRRCVRHWSRRRLGGAGGSGSGQVPFIRGGQQRRAWRTSSMIASAHSHVVPLVACSPPRCRGADVPTCRGRRG